MTYEPVTIKETVEIEELILKSRISKKLRKQLSELIASYRVLYARNTCDLCKKPCMNNWCVTNVQNTNTD